MKNFTIFDGLLSKRSSFSRKDLLAEISKNITFSHEEANSEDSYYGCLVAREFENMDDLKNVKFLYDRKDNNIEKFFGILSNFFSLSYDDIKYKIDDEDLDYGEIDHEYCYYLAKKYLQIYCMN